MLLRKIYEKTTCFIAVPGAGTFNGCLRWSGERSRSDSAGKHPHCYTGRHPGAYPCPHTGEYTEAYTGTYAQAYAEADTYAHTGAHARSYAGTHTGKYACSFCIFLCGPFH